MPAYITLKEAAEVFGVSRTTIHAWRARQDFPVIETGSRSGRPTWGVSVAGLRRWARETRTPIKWDAPLRRSA